MFGTMKWWLLGGLLIVVGGCAVPPEVAEQGVPGDGPSILVSAYQMSVGDQVQVNVWKNPELSVTAPIRPDGKIAVPLVGDVMAAGKEPAQLAADITERLSDYVRNPNVTVILTALEGQEFLSRIRVTGAVVKDASMKYQQGMTVLDAVLEAGSLDVYADANRTKLYRRSQGETKTYAIRLKDIMEDGDMRTNMLLMPGDVITVPERLF